MNVSESASINRRLEGKLGLLFKIYNGWSVGVLARIRESVHVGLFYHILACEHHGPYCSCNNYLKTLEYSGNIVAHIRISLQHRILLKLPRLYNRTLAYSLHYILE